MKKVLFIAGLKERYYYEGFIKSCKRRNILVYIFDPSRVPNNASITVSMDKNGEVSGFIDVLLLEDELEISERISLSDIDIAWYLRENSGEVDWQSLSMEAKFAWNESRKAIDSLMSVLNCVWINHVTAIEAVSSNKLYQQLCASRCGLLIPSTNISNDPTTLQEAARLKGELLLKSIGYIDLKLGDNYNLYSERFSFEELSVNGRAIRSCPIFAQEYVEKKYEYRVMIVGARVLACRIDSQASKKTLTDWRHYDFDNVEHVQVELPSNVSKKLLCFMKEVNLRYGAVDLIETPQGDYVFLEINPSGQWGWIEQLAGLPIEESVAEMIEVM